METVTNQRQALRWVASLADPDQRPDVQVRFESLLLAVEVAVDKNVTTYRLAHPGLTCRRPTRVC